MNMNAVVVQFVQRLFFSVGLLTLSIRILREQMECQFPAGMGTGVVNLGLRRGLSHRGKRHHWGISPPFYF
jgi:hypothetical protein